MNERLLQVTSDLVKIS